MSLDDERMQVLKMLEEGKITAEEAAQLLSALTSGAENEMAYSEDSEPKQKKRRVRIAVSDSRSGKQKATVNLPFGLVKIAKKMRSKFPADINGVDIDEIFMAIENEPPGKVVDVHEHDGGKHVEIFVE